MESSPTLNKTVKGPHDLHVILLGSHNVGKSSLIRNFCHEPFREESSTCIGSKNFRKPLHLSNVENKLENNGRLRIECFRDLNKLELKSAQVVVICYDPSNAESWDGALRCLDDTLSEHVRVYFCATKLDLISESRPRVVRPEVVKVIASHIKAKIIETSAKVPKSADPLFNTIIEDYVSGFPEYQKWSTTLKAKISTMFHHK
ncbi:Ras-related protein Rab-24 [Armadillidium vulgare]|nr:Ras-related protein Rab-24 [Armadillidium vulgare]